MARPKKRIFTESELKEMGADTVDLIGNAIDNGDPEKAMRLARRLHQDAFIIHEVYRDWVASLLSFIGRKDGDQAMYQALHEVFVQWGQSTNKDFRGLVEGVAAGLRGHLVPLSIVEDDDTVTIMMTPCGSGGRAVLNGSYGPPKSFLKVRKPQAMTFGRSDFPVYCCHCAVVDMTRIEKSGSIPWVMIPGEKIGEDPCRFVIYKDPGKVPPAYYERFGLRKPVIERPSPGNIQGHK